MGVAESFVRMMSPERKFVSTNSPSVRPISSLRVGMIAVWGIGSPSGRRKSAVTANQSASAPTMPPSAAARTYASHGYRPCRANAMTKTIARKMSAPRAMPFISRRPRARSWSAALSRAIEVRAIRQSSHGVL